MQTSIGAGTARTSSTGPASVFSNKPAELLGVFTGYMAGGPVVVYLEVCDHEIPLGMSPVMQATGQRIEHTCYIYQLRSAWTSLSRFPAAVGQKQ